MGAADVGMSKSRLDRIEPGLRSFIDRGVVAGSNAVVSRRGEIVHRSSLGHRDREAGVAMTDDTIFRIYSMTKPVVATALMMLQEEHGFPLTSPVMAFIPSFAATQVVNADGELEPQARPMDLRDILTHTSGLTYDFLLGSPADDAYRAARIMNDATRTLEELADAIAEQPLAFQPGAGWRYSVGIDVVARVVEVISGQPLGTFLQERLFGPLGMTDTAFGVPDDQLGRLAAMYGLPDLMGRDYSAAQLLEAALAGVNERHDVSETYPTDQPDTFVRGGVGLFSTIDDYLSFATMLLSGEANGERFLGRKTLELMHTNHVPAELLPFDLIGQPFNGWGFGLGSRVLMDVGRMGGHGSVGEFGWAGAAKTYFWVDPTESIVGVYMSQYMTGLELPEQVLRALTYQAIID